MHLSTSPTFVGGRLSARHVDLRLFAIHDGQDVRVLPGGLTRVALADDALIVNSSQAEGSKDTWVLAPELARGPQTLLWSDRKRPGRAGAAGGHDILSRTAEALFWMGRYCERAEHTARILDVHLQRVIDDPWLDQEQASQALLAVMGVPTPSVEINSAGVTAVLGYDSESRSSVAGALGAARENARGARDVISSEVWECLNTTWLELPDRIATAGHLGPHCSSDTSASAQRCSPG